MLIHALLKYARVFLIHMKYSNEWICMIPPDPIMLTLDAAENPSIGGKYQRKRRYLWILIQVDPPHDMKCAPSPLIEN